MSMTPSYQTIALLATTERKNILYTTDQSPIIVDNMAASASLHIHACIPIIVSLNSIRTYCTQHEYLALIATRS
jgi:hypothetical protein